MKDIRTLCKSIILGMTAFFCLSVYPQIAAAQECGSDHGRYAIYTDLRSIIVYFKYLPEKAWPEETYPKPLATVNFKNAVLEGIRQNFSRCFEDKRADEWLSSSEKYIDRMLEPKTLTITVQAYYTPNRIIVPGVETYGQITYSMWRNDLSPLNSLITSTENQGSTPLFPTRGESSLEKQLKSFIDSIGPNKQFKRVRMNGDIKYVE